MKSNSRCAARRPYYALKVRGWAAHDDARSNEQLHVVRLSRRAVRRVGVQVSFEGPLKFALEFQSRASLIDNGPMNES
jgi:hypothetical protein